EGYINTCQASKVGDPIQPAYLDGILAATLLSDAITFYDRGNYRAALDQYTAALAMPGGNQLRVYNGLYLANLKLGRTKAADEAFDKIVDYGLAKNRLAIKFLFKPGSTAFVQDRRISGPYSFWLKEIAKHTSQRKACLEIIGHTSLTGPEPLNERLSLLRAEFIKRSLEAEAPTLKSRTIAQGVGSRENLVGSGKDDLSDSLDRRVVFNVISC
ncbi:MAG TPA: OmpA family protein, partial [Candidatus Acidoferrales bacterium]|nr:OmpA family protein [Candidatus Acidoferrales bacterium]